MERDGRHERVGTRARGRSGVQVVPSARSRAAARSWIAGVLSLVLGMAMAAGLAGTSSAVGPSCQASSPAGNAYSVRVCLTVGSGTVLSGDATVTATVTISGASPGIRKLEFSSDGQYLLTDFEAPYTFFIPTASWIDGSHTVGVEALLRDGRSGFSPTVAVTFQNGTSGPPPPASGFQPTTGRPALPGEPFTVAITGDGASGQKQSDAVVDLIASQDPNLFLYAGDVYEKGTETEFVNWYGREGERFGTFKSITNPIVGNHEYEGGAAPGYSTYWSGVPDYYSYDAGGWHFIALNSNTQLDEFDPGSAQYEWLRADLAAHPSGCSLAYFHHPVLSVGPQGDTPKLVPIWKLLADKGVDVVVTGHDHQYQRWVPLDSNFQPAGDGTVSFVAGGGGHGIQSTVRTDSRVAAVSDTTADGFGALFLQLSGGSAQYSYINPGGAIRDSGTLTCSGTPADHEAPSTPEAVTAVSDAGPAVSVAWAASVDNRGVATYEIRRDGDLLGSVPSTQLSWVDGSTAPLTAYEYSVRATDLSGNSSPWSDPPVGVTSGDVRTSFTFPAVQDAYVDSAKASSALGLKSELRVDQTPDQEAFVRFDVAGLGARTPTSTVLRVSPASSLAAGFEVRRSSGDWSESGITFDNAPDTGELLASSGPVSAGQWVDIPLAGFVTGDGTYDVALTALSPTSLKLDSRETGSGAELVVGFADTGDPITAGDVTLDTPEDSDSAWVPRLTGGDGSAVTCTIVGEPAHGTATVAPDCSAGSYRPTADFNGADAFTYSAADDAGSDPGTVAVAVGAVNDPPVADPVSADVWEGGSVEVRLSGVDVDGDCPLQFAVSPPARGSLSEVGAVTCTSGVASAPVTYTAVGPGVDTFAFSVTDAGGLSGQGTATIPVSAVPASVAVPVAADGFVDASNPTRAFGSRADLRIDGSPAQRSYLSFSLGPIATHAVGLTLRIRAGSGLGAGFDVNSTTAGWSEGDLTWNSAPAPGALLSTSGPVSSGTWVEIPLPLGAISANGTVDVVLMPLSSTALRLEARESGTPPELMVTTG